MTLIVIVWSFAWRFWRMFGCLQLYGHDDLSLLDIVELLELFLLDLVLLSVVFGAFLVLGWCSLRLFSALLGTPVFLVASGCSNCGHMVLVAFLGEVDSEVFGQVSLQVEFWLVFQVILIIALRDVLDQRAFLWEEKTADVQGLGVVHFTILLLEALLLLLLLNDESHLRRNTEVRHRYEHDLLEHGVFA